MTATKLNPYVAFLSLSAVRAGYRFIAAIHDELVLQSIPIPDSQALVQDHDRKMAEAPDGPIGERLRLTVLFCDQKNSIKRTAQRDPEQWWEIVAEYHRVAVQVIERYGGRVGQYRGDGVMAYFGWPEAHDNDAERAARAGLAILDAIVLYVRLFSPPYPPNAPSGRVLSKLC